MKQRFLFLLVLSGLLWGVSAIGASSVIFSYEFDDKNSGFNGWQIEPTVTKWKIVSGGNSDHYSGTGRAEVSGPTAGEKEQGYSTSNTLSQNISVSGCHSFSLSFWYKIKDSLEDEDHVYVEWTDTGSNWKTLGDFTATPKSEDWVQKYYNFPAGSQNSSSVGIRFRTELGSSGDSFYLDELVFSGDCSGKQPEPTPTPEPTPSPSPSTTPSPTPIPTPIPSVSSRPSPSVSTTSTPAPSQVPLETPTSPEPDSIAEPEVLGLTDEKAPPPTEDSPKEEKSRSDEKDETRSTELMSASISGFVGSKSVWLIGLMVMAVVFSLGKFKKD